MKIAFFSTHSYDIESLDRIAKEDGVTPAHEITFLAPRLDQMSAKLAEGCEGICIFVNDIADEQTLRVLYAGGTRAVFLRCAGFDMIDLKVAKELGIAVTRVPAYSPYAVAEHAAALMMTLNRKIHRSYNRTRTGKIGALFARIAAGFGAKVLAYDVVQSPEALSYGVEYVSQDEIWARADIISLHAPLFPSTKHMINSESIAKMKQGVTIINTSRGGLIDTKALVEGLKSGKIRGVGLDVFEGEGEYFYSDCSGGIIADETLARLFTFPNVIITGHQAFFTKEALDSIGHTTMANIKAYIANEPLVNEVK
ncbi:d-isomer specific 2-hydroxyacid [Plasmopara halstedii]|uniref:D-isomer specific 2-hydroxyacid n=1 Tax=Plasmopara halstedii TaxID=4781 RepID=A0A0P1AFE0_PLAHL|nr:d-isomer specific 2-hydroxyacid [Plasmopara halstedii]CEG39616.1 d-isomer specific 2-hydroxyacid [Plasmopara halstedii]|eukprot:XP_024575985.1 d-isomer specific 2-hydroxyacid [Plasmopara halstedii]